MMFGKPHQICADIIKPFHLFEYFGVQMPIADTRIWRVAKIVGPPTRSDGFDSELAMIYPLLSPLLSISLR